MFIFTALLEICKLIVIFTSSVQTRYTVRIRIISVAVLQCLVC